ncbi:glycosyltransferase family 4 protein [Proteus cibi]|uniref:glycosyltransferase family 4 protein n=1 Tax=Proteus cibi TaxID=2050966 RepID=UPI000D6958B9|nr:glycosyltransferase family 4 protein [Proteus cibi]
MNILHITRNIPIKSLDGNPIILNILKELEKRNIHQKVLFPAEYIPKLPFLPQRYKIFSNLRRTAYIDSNIQLLFYNFIRLPKFYEFSLSSLYINKNTYNFIKNIDIIHAHYILPDGLIAYKLARKKNINYVVSIRQGDIDRIKKIKHSGFYFQLYKKVLENASFLIAINQSIKEYIKNIFNIDVVCIPHGISKDKFPSTLPIKNRNEIIITTCAQLIKRKNIDWVIEVFNRLNIHEKKMRLNIVGDGPLYENLSSIKNEKIHFHGWKKNDEVLEILSNSDIFILPSDNETFGMVYIEAAINGCVIIGKKGTGIDGYLDSNNGAFFISSQEELYSVLKDLIENHTLLADLKAKIYKKAQESFSLEEIITKYINIYEEIK